MSPTKSFIPEQDDIFEVTKLGDIEEESFAEVQDYDFITSADPICSSHIQKRIEAYCQDCKLTICMECILTQAHKNHEIVSIIVGSSIEREN
jgi:hypothetical protein